MSASDGREPAVRETALRVRPADPRDVAALVAFNLALASETEGIELDGERVLAGVRNVFADPSRGSYFLAVRGEEPVGALMVTHEWSDWRNGPYWWIQSVYVVPGERRAGAFRLLYEHVLERARASRDVRGLRLYVEEWNEAAQAAYGSVGMRASSYRMFEVGLEPASGGGVPPPAH